MTNNKIINAGASLIIPGLGQLLNGQTQKGIIFLAVLILLNVFSYFLMNNIFGNVISLAYHVFACYDAYTNFEIK
ncbi:MULTISPECIES: hypothetical protein [Methanobrevibacter]|mgnify:CR=1 FL=1|uniref:hypothetical protein n=1 Tax=Methanobrevibacter TaxID=2172 RepID=UPI0015BB53F0|nr:MULTISPECIES: hypothetical protein [Methanobrevibacter]MBS7256827.1 hypothetical protein [Methanobrevibacter sp.]MCI7429141.1 hypothetical protein [Methanobrevibacter sp.]MDY3097529.1 hypothetical protein [Methanobrevibacter sp.]